MDTEQESLLQQQIRQLEERVGVHIVEGQVSGQPTSGFYPEGSVDTGEHTGPSSNYIHWNSAPALGPVYIDNNTARNYLNGEISIGNTSPNEQMVGRFTSQAAINSLSGVVNPYNGTTVRPYIVDEIGQMPMTDRAETWANATIAANPLAQMMPVGDGSAQYHYDETTNGWTWQAPVNTPMPYVVGVDPVSAPGIDGQPFTVRLDRDAFDYHTVNRGGGLYETIRNSSEPTTPLTAETIRDTMHQVFNVPRPQRRVQVFTNEAGMRTFNDAMRVDARTSYDSLTNKVEYGMPFALRGDNRIWTANFPEANSAHLWFCSCLDETKIIADWDMIPITIVPDEEKFGNMDKNT
jgi:hypothetical protein